MGKCNQEEFLKSGTERKCIEVREWIIALQQAKTNYHIHLIFSERKMLEEPVEKIATCNMFYDENGKHVRTKKKILDEDGQGRKGTHLFIL